MVNQVNFNRKTKSQTQGALSCEILARDTTRKSVVLLLLFLIAGVWVILRRFVSNDGT